MKEIWKPIPRYKGYEASSLGRVRSIPRYVSQESDRQTSYKRLMKGKVLKPWLSGTFEYETVGLCIRGKVIHRSVHILICLAFHGLPPSEKRKNALHKDGDRYHNIPNNIYWGSSVENYKDMVLHGKDRLGEKHPNVKITLKIAQSIYDSRRRGVKSKILVNKYGISSGTICDIFKGRTWPEVVR